MVNTFGTHDPHPLHIFPSLSGIACSSIPPCSCSVDIFSLASAPLADDERPIPSGARMCGEFINPLHYYCNLQQFLVSSMVGGDANGPYFRWSGPAVVHSGGQFCPIRCHSTSVIPTLFVLPHILGLLLTPDTADQQAPASTLGTYTEAHTIFVSRVRPF